MMLRNNPYPPESHTAISARLYNYTPYRFPLELIHAGLTVKGAAADANCRLGYIGVERFELIAARISELRILDEERLFSLFPLDPFMGGAGTSMNMNLNEAIALNTDLDPYDEVNLHQSTNDVLPTALRLYLYGMFQKIESALASLQSCCQNQESSWSGQLMNGRTQLQDAQLMDAGRLFGSWAQAISRDRWRCFKSRERIKEINLGGTAVGAGSGAPWDYVRTVSRVLNEHSGLPFAKADDLMEATVNYDGISEAMSSLRIIAQNLEKIAGDIRFLSSGPVGEIALPSLVKGSSIMAGKNNPVIAEAAVQVGVKIRHNDAILSELAAKSELQLNAFWPLIAWTCCESLELMLRFIPGFEDFLSRLSVNATRCDKNIRHSNTESLCLLPILGYKKLEALMTHSRKQERTLRSMLEGSNVIGKADLDTLLSGDSLTSAGYDPAVVHDFRRRYGKKLDEYLSALEGAKP